MAERVIHPLEVVEVDHHDGENVLGASGAIDGDLKAIAKQSASGKAGERIVMSDVIDVLLGAFALGKVVGDSDVAGDALPRCREVQ